ncbi:MAG: hypothetical protein BGO14_07080 [Chlamydiales bacterium 38-26]|nr:hypothetical protein [Chlamydiales bacterium]OJV10768.1 MAG: hypothetical protein BGO14_07080 [Chlamydiales bacterium 38-26]
MLLKCSEKLKKWCTFSKKVKYKPQWVICTTIFFAAVLTLASCFNPIFATKLENSTKWLGNVTPLILLLVGYFLKEEIANWHYKKRSEAASEIIGKFRICSKDLIYWINARCLNPKSGEDASERKIHLAVNKYVESCLEPSAQFPIQTRKELDSHFEKMRVLANTLSGAVTINTSQQPNKTYGNEMTMKAYTDLQSINSTLADVQDFLDQKLGQYLER